MDIFRLVFKAKGELKLCICRFFQSYFKLGYFFQLVINCPQVFNILCLQIVVLIRLIGFLNILIHLIGRHSAAAHRYIKYCKMPHASRLIVCHKYINVNIYLSMLTAFTYCIHCKHGYILYIHIVTHFVSSFCACVKCVIFILLVKIK